MREMYHESKDIGVNDIEIEVANLFGYRRNIIVPNVSWGMGFRYELDMLVVRPSGIAEEIEIKISTSDIAADLKKNHNHDDPRIKKVWFAVPEHLASNKNIPDYAGIISVYHECFENMVGNFGVSIWKKRCAAVIRKPVTRRYFTRISDSEKLKLLHLGCMRIWGLKEYNNKQRRLPLAGQE